MKRIFCLLLAVSFVLLTACFGKGEEEPSGESSAPSSSQPAEQESSAAPGVLPPLPVLYFPFGTIVNILDDSYANVRSEPNSDSKVIGRAYLGETYLVDQEGSSEEWVKITYKGQEGYIFQAYIEMKE